MKKIVFLSTIILFGTFAFAEPPVSQIPSDFSPVTTQSETDKQQEENKNIEVDVEVKEVPTQQIILQNPNFIVEEKGSQKFYYDKHGRLVARENKIKNQKFFYNKYGQMIGKSINRDSNIYYYDCINKFIGYCTTKECFDGNLNSLGTIPPLPVIKEFKPVIDNNILNPQKQTKNNVEE